ncbi:hypothetical protein [Polyangium aurulentum]|uniref:hypothetical protein n=1 Tax=Polyangium aurulentum TaxID=2567896 RepID=UPI00146BE550|nr:hypothetical protein [Polyangium aurulentum]UQA64066.1 hypothetical protein E8A73_005425 [Polyangium aurulentum]
MLAPYVGATAHVAPELSPEELYEHREALAVALEELKAMDSRLLAVFIAVDLEGLTEAEEPRRHELLVILPPAFAAALLSGEAHAATPPKDRRRTRHPRSSPAVTPPKITPSDIIGPASMGALGGGIAAGVLVAALFMSRRPDVRHRCEVCRESSVGHTCWKAAFMMSAPVLQTRQGGPICQGGFRSVMRAIPEGRSSATRRHVAQPLHRLLKMAVFPAPHDRVEPSPARVPSKGGCWPAKGWLYPDEDRTKRRT